MNTLVATKLALCALLLGSNALAQGGGVSKRQTPKPEHRKWELIKHKDKMTDEVSWLLAVDEKTGEDFSLFIASSSGVPIIFLDFRNSSKTINGELPLVPMRWRVDDSPIVEESWMLTPTTLATRNNQRLLKAMLAGTRLRISIGHTPALEFDIAGLARHLSKLGISTTK
jgi:hypothetical protein